MSVKRHKVEAVFETPTTAPGAAPETVIAPPPPVALISNDDAAPVATQKSSSRLFNLRKALRLLPLSLAILGLTAAVIGVVCTLWHEPVNGYDEGIVLTFADLWTRGKVPNRDFFSNYPPGNYWIIGSAFRIFGHSIGVERGVGVAYRILLTAGIFLLCRPRGTFLAMIAACLAFFAATQSGIVAYAWIGAIAFCVASIALLSYQRQYRGSRAGLTLAAIAALLAGWAALIRSDMPGVGILIASAPLIWQLSKREKIAYALGWFVGVLPLLVHAVRTGIYKLIDNLYIQPLFHIGPARRLPIPPDDSYSVRVFVLTIACIVLVAIGAAFALYRRRTFQNWIYISLALLTASCTLQATARADVPHFMYVGLLAFALVPVAVSQLLEDFVPKANSAVLQLASTSVALSTILYAARCTIPTSGSQNDLYFHATSIVPKETCYASNRDRTIPMHVKDEQTVVTYVLRAAEVLTKPGDRLYVGTGDLRYANSNDLFLYFMLPQLEPAGYHIQDDPGCTNVEGSGLAQEIATADLLILNTFASNPNIPHNGGIGSDEANRVVFSKFNRRTTIGWYEIYTRKPE